MKLHRFLFLFVLIVFASCKEEETKPDYVGEWQTAVKVDPTTSIGQRFDFTFTESTFLTQVYIVANDVANPMLGIKGSLEETEDKTLVGSITDAGMTNGMGDYDWKNKVTNPDEFNAIYAQTGGAIPLDFTSIYVVDGNELTLTIPEVDTIYLTRK